jgi:hypothetical protein
MAIPRTAAGTGLCAWLVLIAVASTSARAQQTTTNYDESKVGSYTLPDPLVMENGETVRDSKTWFEKRRPEIVRLFETNMYGRSPGKGNTTFDVFDFDAHALGGKAIRKQVALRFAGKKDGPTANMLIYLPADAKKPVPLFLVLSFTPNQRVSPEKAVRLGATWDRKTHEKHEGTDATRAESNAPELDHALARGYGFASICYTDIEPDFLGGMKYGVRSLFLAQGQTEPAPDEWGAIAAWGWGLSRALDYLETDRDIDAKRVAIVGYSRLGKTVLWAGARDPRFAMVIAGGSGEGGAALSRRNYGETVKDLNRVFPYWFCANYQQYFDRVSALPFDQHMLLALLAPRPLYLAAAEEDRWADPKGEFLAARAAEPVYRLLGKEGLGTDAMPSLNQPIMHTIGFHYRPGKHAVTAYEWEQYLNFADQHFQQKP